MPCIKIYLNEYPVYTMLDGGSTANLVHLKVAQASSLAVSTTLHPLVGVQGKQPFCAHQVSKPYFLQIGLL